MRKTNKHVELALGVHHAHLQLYERGKRWDTMKLLTPSSSRRLVRSRVFQWNLPTYFRSCLVLSTPQLAVSLSSLTGTKSFKESEQLSECELLSDFKNTVLKIKANKQKELVTNKKIAETMDEMDIKQKYSLLGRIHQHIELYCLWWCGLKCLASLLCWWLETCCWLWKEPNALYWILFWFLNCTHDCGHQLL